jgi:hypothetical protein
MPGEVNLAWLSDVFAQRRVGSFKRGLEDRTWLLPVQGACAATEAAARLDDRWEPAQILKARGDGHSTAMKTLKRL